MQPLYFAVAYYVLVFCPRDEVFGREGVQMQLFFEGTRIGRENPVGVAVYRDFRVGIPAVHNRVLRHGFLFLREAGRRSEREREKNGRYFGKI